MLLGEVAPPPHAEALALEGRYLVCKVDCIPGQFALRREVGPASPEERALFEHWEGRLPRAPEALGLRVESAISRAPLRPGDTATIALLLRCPDKEESCRGLKIEGGEHAFFPEADESVTWRLVEHRPLDKRRGLALQFRGVANANVPQEAVASMGGVVRLRQGEGGAEAPVVFSLDVPRGPRGVASREIGSPLLQMFDGEGGRAPRLRSEEAAGPPEQRGEEAPVGLGQALLLGFLGGMLLNLMPCVFPVLAIKAAAFIRLAHEERGGVLAHGAAYTGGILLSFWALAAAVLGLRAVGLEVGWGFQFQEPWFLVALAAVLVLFSLNLFGVFELRGGGAGGAVDRLMATDRGVARSVAEGVLAVVLATPCSAPLMGTAVGFALTAGAATIVAVFTALGLGLAAPFVALTLVPGLTQRLPRPGPWMLTLKRLLGFALLFTTVWLLWVLGQVAGSGAMAGALVVLVSLALASWCWGTLEARGHGGAQRGLAAAALLAGVALVATFSLSSLGEQVEAGEGAGAEAEDEGWLPWSETRITQELEAGRPVFVDFTADWCITCKVNERTVLARDDVQRAVADLDVAMIKADWTRRQDDIRQVLAQHGKAGVPMYLVYTPGRPSAPQVLPEVLTPSVVIEALRQAAGVGAKDEAAR